MGMLTLATVLLAFLQFSSLLLSSACPTCPYPVPSSPPPPPPASVPCPPPPKLPPLRPPPAAHPPPPTNPPPPPPTHPSPPPPKLLPPPPSPKLPPPPPPPKQEPCPPPPASEGGTCPIDALKLDACVDVLGGLIHIGIGQSADEACCPVVKGLAGLDAALCLCTAIKLNLLGINILLPLALEVLVDGCGKHVPAGFQCPP